MTIYRDKTTGLYRFHFQFQKVRHSSKWYGTRKEARDAEAEERKKLKSPPPPEQEPAPISITFLDLSVSFLEYSEGYNARRVHLNKKASIGKLLRLSGWGTMQAEAITRADIETYLIALKDEMTGPETARTPLKASTINDHRKIIHGLFQYGIDRELLPGPNPCAQVAKMPQPRRADLYIPTDKEVKAVILAAPAKRKYRYMLQCALAARPGEVDALEWQDVSFERREVRLWTRKTSGGHAKSRTVSMNDTAEMLLKLAQERRSDECRYVFPADKTKAPHLDRHGFKDDCEAAGVRPFHRHALRHYAASKILDAGEASVKDIQEILGHADTRTTEIYLHNLRRGREQRRDLMKALEMEGQGEAEKKEQAP